MIRIEKKTGIIKSCGVLSCEYAVMVAHLPQLRDNPDSKISSHAAERYYDLRVCHLINSVIRYSCVVGY